MANRTRDPRTKEELLDRMLSYDFDGDIRHLGVIEAQIKRSGSNKVQLVFPDSGRCYELSVRLPRTENAARIGRERTAEREAEPQSFAPPGREAEGPEQPEAKPRGRPRKSAGVGEERQEAPQSRGRAAAAPEAGEGRRGRRKSRPEAAEDEWTVPPTAPAGRR